MSETGNTAIAIRNVVKRYGSVTALQGATFDIRDNEFFTLLGPSGCGKTTLLRMIAGFEEVSDGQILLFGQDIGPLPPDQRPVNTVFQQYALFPHMTVAENVAFGLRRLRRAASEVQETTHRMLRLVKMEELANRKPSQLSGGQQQRVALARAMAPGPKVLLLDEPLSALDLKLRQEMRVELKQLQQETGITFVFVTHDQEEALTMSDRIAVMSAGEVQQIGTAHEIYEAPLNRFVADFIGETNLIDVRVGRTDGPSVACHLPDGTQITAVPAGQTTEGAAGHVSIRPERLSVVPDPVVKGDAVPGVTRDLPEPAEGPGGPGSSPGQGSANGAPSGLAGTVAHQVYLGTDTQHIVRLQDGTRIAARTQNAHAATPQVGPGDRVVLVPDQGAARLLVD